MAQSSPNEPALPQAAPPAQPGQPPTPGSIDVASLALNNMDRGQIMALLSNLPGLYTKIAEGNTAQKEDAAQALSNLSQQNAAFGGVHPSLPPGALPPNLAAAFPSMGDPGPSSHPRGPPGQLPGMPMQVSPPQQSAQTEEGSPESDDKGGHRPGSPPRTGRRSRSGAAMGSDEWTRQRKDNHKEVERRRRGNINEGINELGRIVPNGSGEKAKGAILSRAVQYIHHLKENEARNIEKWTLEKLLMDQAMGDLQTQLEEVRTMWMAERDKREELEAAIRGSDIVIPSSAGSKRPNEDNGEVNGEKKQRIE